MKCFTVSDRYLFVTVSGKLTVRNLRSNELIKTLSDDPEFYVIGLFIIGNKIISFNFDFDLAIRIWNLNDLKLFKENFLKFQNMK